MGKGKKKEKETDKNPLHVNYGLISNVRYILKIMVRTDRHILLVIALGVVCMPFTRYLWGFLSKIVVDRITGEGRTGEPCGCDRCLLRGAAW